MSFHVRAPFAAWLCVFAYLLAGVLGAQGLVLCVGPLGHAALEVASPGNCGGCLDDVQAPVGGSPSQFAQLPVCPCDDVALPGLGIVAQKLGSNRRVDPQPQSLPTTPVALGALATLRVASCAIDRVADANRAVRARAHSVVLLL